MTGDGNKYYIENIKNNENLQERIMEIDRIIFFLFSAFAVIGGLDWFFNNHLGMGEAFEKGFFSMGPLTLTMAGMIVLAPCIAKVLSPVIVPLYVWMGADPAMFVGSFFACDIGGAPLAE